MRKSVTWSLYILVNTLAVAVRLNGTPRYRRPNKERRISVPMFMGVRRPEREAMLREKA